MALTYLNVYAVTRHYGGPEEGGWWYNAGNPLASIPYKSETDAEADMDKYLKMYGDTAEGDIYSVLGGVDVEVHIESHYARNWPETRPYYE